MYLNSIYCELSWSGLMKRGIILIKSHLVNIVNQTRSISCFQHIKICSILWTHKVNLLWYHIVSLFAYIKFYKFQWLFILQYLIIIVFYSAFGSVFRDKSAIKLIIFIFIKKYIICISVCWILSMFKMIIVLNNVFGVNAYHSSASWLTDNLYLIYNNG